MMAEMAVAATAGAVEAAAATNQAITSTWSGDSWGFTASCLRCWSTECLDLEWLDFEETGSCYCFAVSC